MLDAFVDRTYNYVPYALNACMLVAAFMRMTEFTIVFAALYIKWGWK